MGTDKPGTNLNETKAQDTFIIKENTFLVYEDKLEHGQFLLLVLAIIILMLLIFLLCWRCCDAIQCRREICCKPEKPVYETSSSFTKDKGKEEVN